MNSKTFRLFVSSTFDDFRKEREALQTSVFPFLKQYCLKFGYTFQPIDLRWGINDEAQFNQKALALCLNEVRSCKTYPYPNFILMTGDKYGWIPLPYSIETEEFNQLLRFVSPEEKNSLLDWYKADLNQLPAAYNLKERTDNFTLPESWNPVEQHLRRILQKAAEQADISAEKQQKYFTSITEAEVIEGIFAYSGLTKHQKKLLEKSPELFSEDSKHVFGFFRDLDTSSKQGERFIAEDYDKAQQFKSRVKAVLPEEHIFQCKTVQLSADALDEHYLADFIDRTTQFLITKIKEQQQKEKKETIPELQSELAAQKYFSEQKRSGFTGQTEVLNRIEAYINGNQSQALVVYGKSGIGKSAIMAKAIENSIQKERKVIFRFVGATPNSIHTKKLLTSIFQELGIDVKRDGLPEAFRDFKPEQLIDSFYERASLDEFSTRIADRFVGIQENVVIFIDALDRLNNEDRFKWLPEKLPANLKIIVSVISNETEEITHWNEDDLNFKAQITFLHSSLNKKNDDDIHLTNLLYRTKNLAFIGDYKEPISLLHQLLHQADRTLQQDQEEYFLKQFQKSPTPFYVYVAAQEMKHWKSDDLLDGQQGATGGRVCALAEHQEGMVRSYINNLHTRYHHDALMVQKVFGYIYASQQGLSESEILEFLSMDKNFVQRVAPETWHENIDQNIPLVIWTRLLEDIKAFLSKRYLQGEALLYFFHREFETAITSSDNQKQEHENIILATQEVLKKQYLFNTRCRDVYASLIANYSIAYPSKLKEHALFIIKNIFDDEWIRYQYIGYLFKLSKQFKSYNHEERTFKLSYLVSAVYTVETLYKLSPNDWSDLYLELLSELLEVHAKSGGYDDALMVAEVAYHVAEKMYLQNPEQDSIPYINALRDLAWYNHQNKNEEKATSLFHQLFDLTTQLYKEDPDLWSLKYTSIISNIALFYRNTNTEKSLFYYKLALDISKEQYQKHPERWENVYKKHSNDYYSYYNFELSLFEKIKYTVKEFVKKLMPHRANRG